MNDEIAVTLTEDEAFYVTRTETVSPSIGN